MTNTATRVVAAATFAILAAAIGGRALAQVRTTAHVDTVFEFPCSPESISVRFVGDLTFVTTYHRDAAGTLEIARQHVTARFNHYNPDTGEKTSRDNWSISLTANYAENTTTVTGAYFKLNAVGSGGPVIRDIGRIVFDRAVDNISELDQLWSTDEVHVIDSSGPHEYFNMTIPFPEMYCEADGRD
jgi:hypothetical protein